MSSTAFAIPTATSSAKSKNKKSKRNKASGKSKPNGGAEEVNGSSHKDIDVADQDDDMEEPETPTNSEHPRLQDSETSQTELPIRVSNGSLEDAEERQESGPARTVSEGDGGTRSRKVTVSGPLPDHIESETEARLEAMARDRTALRDEVSQLRKSLEEIQDRHAAEISGVQEQLVVVREEKEQSESQYRDLIGRVSTLRSQLGERLKADAEELAEKRTQIEEIESQNEALRRQCDSRAAELAQLADEGEERSKELSTLRNRMNLAQQNWTKEREDLLHREAYAKEEFDNAKQAMQDWEVLAMEERSVRENLGERVSDLEEQLASRQEAYERVASERDSQALAIDGLQRAVQEIQEARKQELRELVENTQSQIEDLKKQLQQAQSTATESTKALETAKLELERVLPYEEQVKEKNLLIGKLRHEAVILNDHLTKALRQLKRGKQDDVIDRQLVTNHFLHFLALERSDPKKFQVLQIMASILNFTDEQREQSGLARPGTSNPNLRTPISPWHRTPSTPALNTQSLEKRGSIAGLWSEFLQKEAEGGSSRSTSVSGASKPS